MDPAQKLCNFRANADMGQSLRSFAETMTVIGTTKTGNLVKIDGNTFGDSPSVDRKWLVADLSVGAAVNYKNTKFAYAFVYRTEEFYGQKENRILGTVSVNFAF